MNVSRTRGKRKDIRDIWADREKVRAEAGRPGRFQGLEFMSGAQLDAQDAQRRELEMQTLKNKGQFDVADRTQTGGLAIADRQEMGATTRTGMTESGATKRLGMTEDGAMERKQLEEDRLLSRLDFDKSSFDQTLKQRRNESDEDFWLRKKKLAMEDQQFQTTEGRLQNTEENRNRLDLFKTLNQGLGLQETDNFQQNMGKYLNFIADPEAKRSLEERFLALGGAETDTPPPTNVRADYSGDRGQAMYDDAQHKANLATIGTDLGRQESTQQMQDVMQRNRGPQVIPQQGDRSLIPRTKDTFLNYMYKEQNRP